NNQNVKVRILNINGQEINLILNSKLSAGNHQIKFDAKGLTSSIYFYQIETDDFITQKKMILCR
ncbi:MAG: T9SS type A sorting domain-containing protein, partial [Candidatus Delongbacteria bacterium]|nr:T9SS type A sorting domain-containing protein [Candidatus Delongbacteria bacterium]